MKVLFIIGNGFDINLGMKTQYCDFYKYYQVQETKNELIKTLKKNIAKNLNNWSDLERELGRYTKYINSTSEFDEIFENLLDNLAIYLQNIESKYDFKKIDKTRFLKYLSAPEKYLLPADEIKITKFKNGQSHPIHINIISFNYTYSIEKIINQNLNENKIDIYNNGSTFLNKIEHIHGYTDNRMVMGVNDSSQISNTLFHNNQDVLDAIIKSNCNQVQKHNVDSLCKQLINTSDIICIFGSSIGDTDKIWWQTIGNQLKNNCRLIIFSKHKEISPRKAYLKSRIERDTINLFLEKTDLTEEEKKIIKEKIFVVINSNIFNFSKN